MWARISLDVVAHQTDRQAQYQRGQRVGVDVGTHVTQLLEVTNHAAETPTEGGLDLPDFDPQRGPAVGGAEGVDSAQAALGPVRRDQAAHHLTNERHDVVAVRDVRDLLVEYVELVIDVRREPDELRSSHQAITTPEVIVDQTDADPGCLGDRADADTRFAHCFEQLDCHGENRLATPPTACRLRAAHRIGSHLHQRHVGRPYRVALAPSDSQPQNDPIGSRRAFMASIPCDAPNHRTIPSCVVSGTVPETVEVSEGVPTATTKTARRIGMRWKLLFAFGLGITIVFIAVAGWILRFSTNTANDRVRDTLRSLSVGGAEAVDAEDFAQLVSVPALPTAGDVYPSDAGQLAGTSATADSVYPTDSLYWAHIDELVDIRRTNPEASPYSFYEDADGVVRFVGSWGALGTDVGLEEPAGALFQQDALDVLDEAAREYLSRGLTDVTEQPPYTDTLGSWIAVLTPIVDDEGSIVGGLGIDYPLEYIAEVRRNVIRVLYPAFAVAYLILLALVFYLSGWLTKRLARLSSATKRIADGDYDVDLSTAARARFPDEMTELASSFIVMTEKVGTRERDLTRQVQILKVEIDQKKREEAVSEIVDSDFFNDLTSKANAIRARVKAQDEAEAAASTGSSDA